MLAIKKGYLQTNKILSKDEGGDGKIREGNGMEIHGNQKEFL